MDNTTSTIATVTAEEAIMLDLFRQAPAATVYPVCILCKYRIKRKKNLVTSEAGTTAHSRCVVNTELTAAAAKNATDRNSR